MEFSYYPSHQVVPNSPPSAKTMTTWNGGGDNSNNMNNHHHHDHDRSSLLSHDEHLQRSVYCPDCGIVPTHALQYETAMMATSDGGQSSSAVIVHKEPLTIQGKVYQGRCIVCHPLPSNDNACFVVDCATNNGTAPRQTQVPHSIPQEEEPQETSHAQHQQGKQISFHEEELLEEENDEDQILEILWNMRRHPHDLQLQISSFHSLWVLSYETENALAIGRVGGIPLLLEILRHHLDAHLKINNRYNRNNNTSSPSFVQQMVLHANGLATLQNLSIANEDNAKTIVEHEGVPLILGAMSNFMHDRELVCAGCNALSNILSHDTANNGSVKSAILSNGGFNTVLTVGTMQDQNEGAVEAAYKCLHLLKQDDSHVKTQFRRSVSDGTDGEVSSRSHSSSEQRMDKEFDEDKDFLMEIGTCDVVQCEDFSSINLEELW